MVKLLVWSWMFFVFLLFATVTQCIIEFYLENKKDRYQVNWWGVWILGIATLWQFITAVNITYWN